LSGPDPSPDLVERARAGDADAAEALAAAHLERLWRFAVRYLRDADDAADAVQETWVKVLRGLPTFRPGAPFAPWLFRIAANVCADIHRARRRSVPVEEAPEPVSPAPAPEDAWALAAALERLPDRYRRAVELRYGAELPIDEVAGTLGVPVGTAKTLLHRAKGRLREILLERGETRRGGSA
jgi:RNA polymerase sigma-70 factor (ECF subfamily)